MYEIREFDRVISDSGRVRLRTSEIGDVLRHMEAEHFRFIGDIPTGKAFAHADGRTATVRVTG